MTVGLFLLLLLGQGIHFVDVARQAGVRFQHRSGSASKDYVLETISGGVAWIDYDRDGWPDLYLSNGGEWAELLAGKRLVRNALFHNNGDGTFTDVTARAGLGGRYWSMGVAVADYDNDGWPDLYLCAFGRNTLFHNNGDGTFTDVTARAGLGAGGWSSSAAFADYDLDGDVDLYVTRYVVFDPHHAPPPHCRYRGIEVHCGPKGMKGAADSLFRNNGDGTFTEVSGPSGIRSVRPSYGLGVLWFDSDDDGDPDLYVANDSMPNFLFINQGHGRFEEVGLLSGAALSEDGNAQAGMGVTAGDYDHDGRLDLFVTNFADDYNTLYRNLGSNRFLDVSYAAGVAFPSWQKLGWGTRFFDYDNDGWEDLFVSDGHIYPQVEEYEIGTHFKQGKLVFRNLGRGRFREVTARLGRALGAAWSSRGAAFADYDRDGDVDVAINNMDGPASLFRNEGGNRSGAWVEVILEGRAANRGAIGARVLIESGEGRQVQEVRGGSSYQSTNDPVLHFGLGQAARVGRLRVRWPGGGTQEFRDLPVRRWLFIRQGEPVQVRERPGP